MRINEIRNIIERIFENHINYKELTYVIYPYGEVGMQFADVLKKNYQIANIIAIDNHLSRFNDTIMNLGYLEHINTARTIVILTTTNLQIYEELKKNLSDINSELEIIEILTADDVNEYRLEKKECRNTNTRIGKYSYGPLCTQHYLIAEIGAFCSFAEGCAVVRNHPMKYITTHPIIYEAGNGDNVRIADYDDYSNMDWYMQGIHPHGVENTSRIVIGNDVWFGKNVIITNSANIGNGVIAGAGAVITKNVPDYAIVTGIPARIVRFRFNKRQIEMLNQIKWWEWSDELIRKRYEDFYLPVDEFINKYAR